MRFNEMVERFLTSDFAIRGGFTVVNDEEPPNFVKALDVEDDPSLTNKEFRGNPTKALLLGGNA
jgi:hypothetical protein